MKARHVRTDRPVWARPRTMGVAVAATAAVVGVPVLAGAVAGPGSEPGSALVREVGPEPGVVVEPQDRALPPEPGPLWPTAVAAPEPTVEVIEAAAPSRQLERSRQARPRPVLRTPARPAAPVETPAPAPGPGPSPSVTPDPTPSPEPSPDPTPSPTPEPHPTPSPTSSPAPSPTPEVTASPDR